MFYLTVLDGDVPGWRNEVPEMLKAVRNKGIKWPNWCLCPVFATYAVCAIHGVTDLAMLKGLASPSVMAGLYDWTFSKSIWRFDPGLAEALAATDINDEIPVSVLFELPEWCIYIESPALETGILGAYCFLDYDINNQRSELQILLDRGGELYSLPLHLDEDSVVDALRAAERNARKTADSIGLTLPRGEMLTRLAKPASVVISHLMYIASMQPDIITRHGPEPRKLRGVAMRPAVVREVGYRVGQALRRRYTVSGSDGGHHSPPAAHLRKAHWHHYWTGPKNGERKLVLRWLHPMFIGAGEVKPVVKNVGMNT